MFGKYVGPVRDRLTRQNFNVTKIKMVVVASEVAEVVKQGSRMTFFVVESHHVTCKMARFNFIKGEID